MLIETARTTLRPWRDEDAEVFAAMHADADVMQDYGGPISRAQSIEKLGRYQTAFEKFGICRWAIEDREGDFIGYAGVMPIPTEYPIAPGFDIGWRLVRRAWGKGFASEATAAALTDAFARAGLAEVVSFTSQDNERSRAVMSRLNLRRDQSRDFTMKFDEMMWSGLVWVADQHWRAPVRRSVGSS
jgi:RimJ/RimL family protein N-acetyltransferase